MPSLSLSPAVNKCTQLVYALEERILAGEFDSQTGIPPETEICALYGVSRSTVREAVTTLVARGLVERKHGVGLVVVNRTLDASGSALRLAVRSKSVDAASVLAVRQLLEVQSAGWAAQHRSGGDLIALRESIDVMEDTSTTLEAYVAADFEFHLKLAQGTGNAALVVMLEAIAPTFQELIRATLTEDFRPEPSNQFHRKILTAVEAGNPLDAEQAMREHMRATEELLHAGH